MLERVALIFLPIKPDLPTPEIINFPFDFAIRFITFTKLSSSLFFIFINF